MVVEKIAVSYTSHATQEKITGLSQWLRATAAAASRRGGWARGALQGPSTTWDRVGWCYGRHHRGGGPWWRAWWSQSAIVAFCADLRGSARLLPRAMMDVHRSPAEQRPGGATNNSHEPTGADPPDGGRFDAWVCIMPGSLASARGEEWLRPAAVIRCTLGTSAGVLCDGAQ